MKRIIEYLLVFIVVIFGGVLFLLSNHVLGFRAFTVMSGSMEPIIKTGSLVITESRHPASLKTGDIITFIRPDKNHEFITHRISGISQKRELSVIKTKGDHNNSGDPWILAGGGVVGKVIYTVPQLGYLLSFTKTKLGILLFIIAPAFFVIYLEVANFLNILRIWRNKNVSVSGDQTLVIVLFGILLLGSSFKPTNALLSDSASLSSNIFTILELLKNTDCGSFNVDVSGNEAGSTNVANISVNCTKTVVQSNHTTINNVIQSSSTSGGNHVSSTNYATNSGGPSVNADITTSGSSNISN